MIQPPGRCAACGEALSGGHPFIYGVGRLGTTYDQADAFGTRDPLLDCRVCLECPRHYGRPECQDGDRMEWLRRYKEDDAKLLSVKQCLCLLGGD
jgi:hypothetical protein